MDKEKLIELKKQLLELRKNNLTYITRRTLTLLISSILIATTFKISGAGWPYIKDKNKKYKIETCQYDNLDNTKITSKYELQSSTSTKTKNAPNTITIKTTYQLDNNKNYFRKVYVYKLKEKNRDNHQEVLENYKDFQIEDNKIDEYIEQDSTINPLFITKMEVSVTYHNINKTDYIEVEETNHNNLVTSIIYSIILLNLSSSAIYKINNEYAYNEPKIKQLKDQIKKEESHTK